MKFKIAFYLFFLKSEILVLYNFSCQEAISSREFFWCSIIELSWLEPGYLEMRKIQVNKNLCPKVQNIFVVLNATNRLFRAMGCNLDECTKQLHEALLTWFSPVPLALCIFLFTNQPLLQGHSSARVLSAGHNKHLHLTQGIKKQGQPRVVYHTAEAGTIKHRTSLIFKISHYLW